MRNKRNKGKRNSNIVYLEDKASQAKTISAEERIRGLNEFIRKYPNNKQNSTDTDSTLISDYSPVSPKITDQRTPLIDDIILSELKNTKDDLRVDINDKVSGLRTEIRGNKELLRAEIEVKLSKGLHGNLLWIISTLLVITGILVALYSTHEQRQVEQFKKETKYIVDERLREYEDRQRNITVDTLLVNSMNKWSKQSDIITN